MIMDVRWSNYWTDETNCYWLDALLVDGYTMIRVFHTVLNSLRRAAWGAEGGLRPPTTRDSKRPYGRVRTCYSQLAAHQDKVRDQDDVLDHGMAWHYLNSCGVHSINQSRSPADFEDS